MPPIVFISYRRSDTSSEARELRNALRTRLGPDKVYFDTSSIDYGEEWPASLRAALAAVEVVIVVIGPSWLVTDEWNERRINDETDWVHQEIAMALREKKHVIPVLVRDGKLPPANRLPEALGALAGKQAASIRRDDWDHDVEPLLDTVCRHLSHEASPALQTESIRAAPHEVPSPITTFVGRDAEIDRLVAAFSDTSKATAVTICGVRGLGGVGKTQLALAVAQRLIERFPDGQILVELAGMSEAPLSPEAALRNVLRALGAEPATTADLAQLKAAYRSATHDKRVLVLADDARDKEHVAFLVPSSGCALLVTSRAHIFLSGMTQADLVDLHPLAVADAEALLLKTCPRIGAEASRIAARCGHLPLALQVCASLLANDPTLAVDELVTRLDDERSKLAALKAPDDPNLDVEAALTLSFDRLEPNARSALIQASIFPASFTREAAEAVIRFDAHDVGATIAALRDLYGRSLVEFDAATKRYSLHDLTQVFASAHLSDDEQSGVQARYIRYFAAVLSEANGLYKSGGKATREGLRRFDAERVHIEMGERHATERYRKGDKGFAPDCFTFALAGDEVLSLRLHPREYAKWLEVAVEAARTLNDRGREAIALGNLGNAYMDLGDARKAIEYFEQDLAIAREVGDRRGEGMSLGNLGIAYSNLGDIGKAIEYFEQVLAITCEVGDHRSEGITLGNLGGAYFSLGDARKAIEYYEQDLAIAREVGDRRGEGSALGNLGSAYSDLGDAHKAIEYYEQHLVIAREVGDRRGEGVSSFNLSLALQGLGRTEEAIDFARNAVELYEQSEHPSLEKARKWLADLLKE